MRCKSHHRPGWSNCCSAQLTITKPFVLIATFEMTRLGDLTVYADARGAFTGRGWAICNLVGPTRSICRPGRVAQRREPGPMYPCVACTMSNMVNVSQACDT